jgi:transcription initiation factor TFIID subunit 1, fungi type
MAPGNDEENAISALTGFSLNHLLDDLSLPAGAASGLANQLGISGMPNLNSGQIYNDKWDEDGAVGVGQGKDWEDEIDQEMQGELDDDDAQVKQEVRSPDGLQRKQKRIRVVKRLVERPKTVYERFPAFEKDKTLDFTELFKGYTVPKSRLAKRYFQGEREISRNECCWLMILSDLKLKRCIRVRRRHLEVIWKLWLEMQSVRSRISVSRMSFHLATSSKI